MSIKNVTTDFSGQIGVNPRLVRLVSSDAYNTVIAENYLAPLVRGGYVFYPTDVFFISYDYPNIKVGIFTVTITSASITLIPFNGVDPVIPTNPDLTFVSSVETPTVTGNFASFQDTDGTIGDNGYAPSDSTSHYVSMVHAPLTPVTAGNFSSFYDTNGTIQDSGYSPTQPAATKVVMFNGGTLAANYIAVFADTAGTIRGSAGSNAIYPGAIQAGLTGTAGSLISYPAASNNGYLKLAASSSPGNYTTTIQNGSMGQNTALTIYDPHSVAASILTTLVIPDPGANVITFDITIGHAALASGGSVNLYVPFNGTSQYKIRSLQINAPGTNFSGGGGDRLLSITDNTTVYSLIPAATLQALVNAGWGSTDLPYPASVPINTSTAAGASLVAKYSGGTTDYSAGSVVISGMLERVI